MGSGTKGGTRGVPKETPRQLKSENVRVLDLENTVAAISLLLQCLEHRSGTVRPNRNCY